MRKSGRMVLFYHLKTEDEKENGTGKRRNGKIYHFEEKNAICDGKEDRRCISITIGKRLM